MYEILHRFWEINYVPLYATYGQAFFILGMIALLSNHRQSSSPLARAIWLLGLYALTHAFRAWGVIFIPIQATYLPREVISTLEWIHLSLLVISFLFLMGFTVQLIVLTGWGPRALWGVPVVLGLGWVITVMVMYGVWNLGPAPTFRMGDILARYGIALPASLFASWVLWNYAVNLPPWTSRNNVRWFRALSLTFIGFALVDGLITPRADFFPANVLNYATVYRVTAIPIPFYRIVMALILAVSMRATINLFEEEMQQRIHILEQEHMLLADRERISRELHDHTIQALYALGLEVEMAANTLHRSPEQARQILEHIMERLNVIISEARAFVYNLRDGTTCSLPTLIEQAIDAFHAREFLNVQVEIDPSLQAWHPTPDQAQHLRAILEEALSNVIKHAQTKNVRITAADEDDSVILCVCDQGKGFDMARVEGGMGLRHMRERAHQMGGVLHVHSHPHEGTKVRIIVPVQRQEGNAYHEPAVASALSG